jgi:hypothetical protein
LVSVKETRLYSFAIDAIMACFSNPALLSESAKSDPSQSEDKWIFSIWIQTIGNIMITKDGDELKVIDYSTFYRYVTKLDKTPPVPDFIEWTKPLTLFFDGIKSSGVRFHRIIALHEVLCAFIELYDPKNIRGAKRPSYWELLHKQEQKHIGELILKFNPQYKPLK